ncbi:MAG: FliM/FliN family flagellar motor switch protein [Armatimonadetes bacterium]|nr:FliM/FliN family flagellar motor switch protein [Armatimonadota bacterium]
MPCALVARPYDLANPPLLTPSEEAAAMRRASALERALADLASAYLAQPVRACLTRLADPREAALAAGELAWFAPRDGFGCELPRVGVCPGLCGQFAARMVGARERRADRELTEVERELVGLLCGQVAPGCLAAWGWTAPQPGAWVTSGNPAKPDPRAGLLLQFEVGLDGQAGTLGFWLPADIVREQPASVARRGIVANSPAAQEVQQATVRATVVLGTCRLTLAALAALKPGDLIGLGTPSGAPLEMRIQGRAKLHVRPGLCRGRIAVQVLGDQAPECEFREHHPGDRSVVAA